MSTQQKLVAAAVFIGVLGVAQNTYQTIDECQKWNAQMDRIDAVAQALIAQKNTLDCDGAKKYKPGTGRVEDDLKARDVEMKCMNLRYDIRQAERDHDTSRRNGPIFCRRVYGKHR